ncbi:hypothetical protein I8920_13910 [Curtobacterium sp. YC1]|uniref:hypothetical protein n=1 Tax=Curtobacterium sp. YC1 TaxID=2795488 RepID=UPI0018E4F895|nr:hypothetical protein [Curtobacterium sp. YC1]QQD75887.1 hypothetical protein I8920_13910 [Curtobacterium sp. YC1]
MSTVEVAKLSMREHRWAPAELRDVPVHAVDGFPLDRVSDPQPLDAPAPVWVDPFEHIGPLRGKAFAVAQYDVPVYVEISWQGRLQRTWAPRGRHTPHRRTPSRLMARRRRDRWALGPAFSLLEAAGDGPDYDMAPLDPVLAWVHFPDRILEVEAHVIEYKERAVLVEWEHAREAERAWIWRDAVQRR